MRTSALNTNGPIQPLPELDNSHVPEVKLKLNIVLVGYKRYLCVLETNGPQYDRPAGYVVAHQYSSVTFFSLCVHSRMEIFCAFFIKVISLSLVPY